MKNNYYNMTTSVEVTPPSHSTLTAVCTTKGSQTTYGLEPLTGAASGHAEAIKKAKEELEVTIPRLKDNNPCSVTITREVWVDKNGNPMGIVISGMPKPKGGTKSTITYVEHGTYNESFIGHLTPTLKDGPTLKFPSAPAASSPQFPCGDCVDTVWLRDGDRQDDGEEDAVYTWEVKSSPNSYKHITCSYPMPHSSHNTAKNVKASYSNTFNVNGKAKKTKQNWTSIQKRCYSCEDCGTLCSAGEAGGQQTRPKTCQPAPGLSISCLEAY